MDRFAELLNFFGNPDLDRHRLLQGQWKAYRLEWDDPEGWTDRPLETLLTMLAEEVSSRNADNRPSLRALAALLSTALGNLSNPEFSSIRRTFWIGFQFVSQAVAADLGSAFKPVSRADLLVLIEKNYQPHPS